MVAKDSAPQAWGSKYRVQTGMKNQYDYLVGEYPQWFPNLTDLFEICAAIGLWHGDQKDLDKKENLANLVNLDTAVFYVLLSQLYPDKSAEERLEELERYAEYGVALLYESMRDHGEVGFLQFLKPALETCHLTESESLEDVPKHQQGRPFAR
jgi:hypothetical protein